MVDVADFYADPTAAFYTGASRMNALDQTMRTQQAARVAGNALQTGDYRGASSALLGAGDIDGGVNLQRIGVAEQTSAADQAAKQRDAGVKFMASAAGHLLQVHQATVNQANPQGDVNQTLAAFDAIAPQIKQFGESDTDIAQLRSQIAANPGVTLTALGAGAEHELANGGDGYLGDFDKTTGGLRTLREGRPHPLELDPKKFNYLPDDGSTPPSTTAPSAAGTTPAATPSVSPTGTPSPDAVWASIHQQESGGQASPGTAVGPDTPYGNALGSTQMLPATAEAMAHKVGLPWNPALMRENTPQALTYQDKLGRAYFDEGLAKSNGDPAGAAAYYYGGPDPSLHGPKTQAYVQQVMARASGGAGAAGHGAAGGAAQASAAPVAPTVPGYHLITSPAGDTDPDDVDMTPEAVTMAATRYAMMGTLPPLGQGKAARTDKVKIQNRASDLIKQWNIQPEDWVTGLAQVKVAQGTLQTISKQRAQIGSFEATANDNANLALSLMNKGAGPTGVPVIDRYVRAGMKATGDKDVAAFDSALGGFADEYAKIVSGSMGNAPTSDSVRASAHDRINSAMSKGQLSSVIGVMRNEMANRIRELDAEQARQTAYLHTIGPGQAPAMTPPGAPASDPLSRAREALAKGAPRAAVLARLQQNGIDTSGL